MPARIQTTMQTQSVTTTISKANQTAVPSKVRCSLNLQSGDTLVWQLPTHAKNQTVKIKPTPRKWGQHMKGLGKELWQDIDTEEYVADLRHDREVQ